MSEFVSALLFGAVIIAVFSHRQFETPSYEPSQELTRLIEFLQPSDLRNRRAFRRAYMIYAGFLLLIYVMLCVFMTPPMLEALGFVFAETSAPDAQSALVPLGVSLAMVGLAPSVPILQQFESRIRLKAHSLSGIPARLLHGCRLLNSRHLDLKGKKGLMVPEREWARMEHYFACADSMLDDPADFRRDWRKITAFRAWFIEGGLNIPGAIPSTNLIKNEASIATRIDQLVLGLDALSGFGRDDAGPLDRDLARQPREIWQKFAAEADKLAADTCGLLMLYVEHDLISLEGDGSAESEKAAKLLHTFLENVEEWSDDTHVVGKLWWRATLFLTLFAGLWGLFLGNWENCLGRTDCQPLLLLTTSMTYALSACLTYSLAIFIALALHDRAVRMEGRDRWANMFLNDWTLWVGRAGKLFVAACIGALVSVVGLNLYWSMWDFGVMTVARNFISGVLNAAAYEGPRALLGPILALGIVAVVDSWRARMPHRTQALLIGAMVIATAALAMLTRSFQIQYADLSAGRQIPMLSDLIGDPRLWATALRSALLSLIVLAICRRTLEAGPEPIEPGRH